MSSPAATLGIVTVGKAHFDFMEVLRRLDKGHTRADVFQAFAVCRRAGTTISAGYPTFRRVVSCPAPFNQLIKTGQAKEIEMGFTRVNRLAAVAVEQGLAAAVLSDLKTGARLMCGAGVPLGA